MAIKRILVPFDGSKHSKAAAEYAFHVARAHGAEIEGLGLVDVGPIERVERGGANIGGFAFASDARQSLFEKAKGHAGEFQQQFVERCRKEAVPYEYRFDVADPIERINERSFYADLIVMGIRTDFDPETESESFDKLQKALHVTARPFLAVPVHERDVRRALVALDFDAACARLLFGLVHANPYPKAEVTLLHVGDAKAAGARLDDAVSYLGDHGIEASARTEIGKAVEVVPRVVETDDFDLAVVGGNSGGRLSEFFFGSVTRSLLGRGLCPVLTVR